MAPASEKRLNAKGNKYTVNVSPSSTPNRRFLLFILVAAALVALVVLLFTLIPMYMKSSAEENSNEQLSEQHGGKDFLTNSITRSTVISSTTPRFSIDSVETSRLPSATATSTDFQQGQTSPLPKDTSLTTTTASITVTPILSSVSAISSTSSVADRLSVIAKLVPNTESKWSRWSSWSDCTKTCGTGTRQRTRTCVAINPRAVFAPISCAGKPTEINSCAEWSCPDCAKNCTIGTMNEACDACTCDHHVLTGRVLTKDGAPLSEANISLAETPYNILAQTNISGFFTALGVCAGQQELLVTKTGFVPVRQNATVLTPTTANITAKLEIAVSPFVTVHPESKIRMPGQSVTFCCDGEGNPPPEVEWFKDNNIIDKDLYNYNEILVIPDVTGLNGSFRCRVVNQFGSEFSTAAQLTVLEEGTDSCSPTPNSKNLTLPNGCVTSATHSSIIDVGECQPVACLKNDSTFNSSCEDPSSCCGPRDFTNILVDCGSTSFNISKVTHCACGNCAEKVAIIEGIVVGGQNEEPVRYGDVVYNGKAVTYTDEYGKFSITIPGKLTRVIVTFKDYFKEFEERSKVFEIQERSVGFHKVKLKRSPPPIAFNASKPLNVSLGSDPSDSFADLEFQEESFLTENGSVFHGNAKATISVTDPRNLSDILTAPGDFSTTDEEGEAEILETYGMVKLKFEDDNGKQLALSKPMKVNLDPEKLNLTVQSASDAPIKLYWLDKKTERWREVGDFRLEDASKRRRKRDNRVFFVGTVTPAIAREQLNFDLPATRVAVRVTTDPYPRTSSTAGVVVRVIRQEGTVYRGYIEKTTTADGLVCIPIWRNKTCHIQAESNGKYMVPTKINDLPGYINAQRRTNGTIEWIQFESILDENSALPTPMYKHTTTDVEPEKCKSSAVRSKGSQFTFQEPTITSDDFTYFTNYKGHFKLGESGCFIKVKIKGENAIFAAESYKENDLNETGKIGLHIRMSRNVTTGGSTRIVCLQFSCPTNNAYTYVKIAPLTKICTLQGVHGDLSRVQHPNFPSDEFTRSVRPIQPPAIRGEEKWLWIPKSGTGQTNYRTFKNLRPHENKCLVGNQGSTGTSSKKVTDSGYAIEYNCS